MNKVKTFFYGLTLAVLPGIVSAQTRLSEGQIEDANDVVELIFQGINIVTTIVVSLSVLWIIIGIFQYFIAGGEDDRKTGRDKIAYGVLGVAIMLSIWGLVNLVRGTFDTNDNVQSRQQIEGLIPR